MKFGEPLKKIGTINKSYWVGRPVKIVDHPSGKVDVCPFPETHYNELSEQARRLRYPIPINKFK